MNFGAEERELSIKVSHILSEDFDIYPEEYLIKHPGKFMLDGIPHKSIPDLLIKPKVHLLEQNLFIDTIIPIELKKFNFLEINKFENLMFQCHSYRFSTFNNLQPKACLYFIDDYFESSKQHLHLQFDYELSKDPKTSDFQIKKYMSDKKIIETLFGRFGIGEIITWENGYTFRIKRQVLFQKRNGEFTFKPHNLNFWWGNNRNSKKI